MPKSASRSARAQAAHANDAQAPASGADEAPAMTLMTQAHAAWVAYLNQLGRQGATPPVAAVQVGKAYMELFANMAADPTKLFSQQAQFWQDSVSLWTQSAQRFFQPGMPPETAAKDRRFKDKAWEESAAHSFLKQSYELVSGHLQQAVHDVDGLSPHTARMVEFYTKQMLDAASPSNLPSLNPEVLRATIETKGENLLHGWQNLLHDMQEGRVRMTATEEFELGRNIAATPGSVVYQNELMQLIQYAPTTTKVHEVPILLVPAWINKFYILDLSPENSMVKWLTDQGFTVFMVSWVNPDERYAATRFDDYMKHGILAALGAVEKATGSDKTHLAGYCLGGTLLSITMAWLHAKKQQNRVASATYLTTLTDFAEPGDLGVFVDEEQIAGMEAKMAEKGYLEGREMALTFNALRANDLIWSFVVNNYYLGKTPLPFDLLFWNMDATRLPAAMHSFYLRKMYLENKLKEPGGIIVDGIAIDLRSIKTPTYMLSTREDHIAPWASTYAATQLFSGETRFVLATSGHIAGVVNPPSKNKYSHQTNDTFPESPEAWLEGASDAKGSWWPDWASWLAKKSGPNVPARIPGEGALKALEAAPGSYVRVMSD